ncbi:MAG TPA: PAS domain S-box protein [Patescibacteria group bacterium]|nr:PAS domain S-box protein [Patescibacteria group bacterium]
MKQARPRRSPSPRPPDVTGDAAARLAAIVDASDDAIVSETLDGIITSWNPAAEKLFGWPASAALGRHVTLIIPPERHAEEPEMLVRVRRGDVVNHFETVRVTKDGRLVDISLTVSPVKDSTGHIVGASKIARDIRERRRFDETRGRLAAIVDSSEDVIISKTLDGIITSWNGAAERMFGWTPAEAIGRHLTLIIPEERRAEEDEVIAKIRRGERVEHFDTVRITRDRRLIDVSITVSPVRDSTGRIDVSRVVTGNLQLDLRLVELRNVIEGALETVRPAAAAKHIEIETDFDATPATVLGAADRLQQVVWNLLMNAVKFTPRDGRACVRLRRGETEAEISVTDSGEGIGPDVLPYVFDRFRQEDSSSTRAHAGLGLGLALVRHIIELHGGAVTAESPGKGRGATFTVRLPLAPPVRGGGP